MGMIYLASPYSHPNEAVRVARFEAACKAAGELKRRGEVVFSPIAHSHPIAMMCRLPTDWEYWKRVNTAQMKACDRLIVLMLPGWIQSKGVAAEREMAEEMELVRNWIAPKVYGIEEIGALLSE